MLIFTCLCIIPPCIILPTIHFPGIKEWNLVFSSGAGYHDGTTEYKGETIIQKNIKINNTSRLSLVSLHYQLEMKNMDLVTLSVATLLNILTRTDADHHCLSWITLDSFQSNPLCSSTQCTNLSKANSASSRILQSLLYIFLNVYKIYKI